MFRRAAATLNCRASRHAGTAIAPIAVASPVHDDATAQTIDVVVVAPNRNDPNAVLPMPIASPSPSADPAIDHRADIYAFGAMAYEMLPDSHRSRADHRRQRLPRR